MSGIANALTIINLLYNRRRVTIDEFIEVLGVSKRTIYRYLNKISEANIPVYFDRYLDGYTVLNREYKGFLNLHNTDYILLVIALKLLEKQMPRFFKDSMRETMKRLHINSPFPLSKMKDIERIIDIDGDQIDVKDVIDFFIQAALILNRGIVIHKKSDDASNPVILNSPKLEFDNEWRLYDTDPQGQHYVEREDITFLEII